MNEFCLALLTNLLRTTAYLSAAAILVGVLLKISHCQSPRVHRVAWCLVLLQGLLFVRIPWSIAWLPRPVPVANRTEILPRLEEPSISSIDPRANFPMPPNEETISIVPSPAAPEQPSQTSVIAGVRNHWPILAALFWLGGMVVVAGVWVFRYLRFLRTVPAGEQGDAQWQQEFATVLGKSNRSAAIQLRITDDTGPLVCRRSGRYSLLVPRPLWESLSAAERQAILRHEIGHYRRGDLWKSVAIRMLALAHWFNPFAWLAVRRFDEAAEWACDELAANECLPATEFASILLKLCASTKLHRAVARAATGSGVSHRIRRLLSTTPTEDSIMKKLLICGMAAFLLLAGALRVTLVAEDEPPLPTRSPANPPLDAGRPNPQNADYAREMIGAAEHTFEATQAAYDAGTLPMEPIYTWSRKWMQSILDVAVSPTDRIAAYRDHRDRMQSLYNEVHTKFLVGAKGGEADRNYAAKFYLAEANLWLDRELSSLRMVGPDARPSDTSSTPQIEVYPIKTADPETVLKVLQTALSRSPDVRLIIDPKSNSIVAQARASEQARIRDLIGKLDLKSLDLNKPGVEVKPQGTRVVYEVKSPEELIKILQPLLAGQSRIETKSLAGNSQLIVSAPAEQQEAIRALVEKLNKENLPNQTLPERRETPPR